MKKFCISVFGLVLLFCVTLGFTACDNAEKKGIPDLADCEIGYELSVYPTCEFSYKVNDECTVKVTEFSATLTAKNTISEGDILEEAFTPYIITIKAKGLTSISNEGKELSLLLQFDESFRPSVVQDATVDNTGVIIWEVALNITSLTSVCFSKIF